MRLTALHLVLLTLAVFGLASACEFTATGPTVSGDVAGPDDDGAGVDTSGDGKPGEVVVIDRCAPATQPAWFTQGLCATATGTHTCDPETGTWTFDSTGVAYERDGGTPLEKTCDGLDNDCDGSTDEDLVLTDTSSDAFTEGTDCLAAGVCSGKARAICNSLAGPDVADPKDRWICDYSQVTDYEPTEISCDGKDNDCNGKTDRNLDPSLSDCETDGVCGALKLLYYDAETPEGAKGVRCEEGAWRCEYSVVPGWQEAETLCDGLDNDCDGDADEADTDSGVWADVDGAEVGCKVAGVCLNTRAACAGGTWVCAYPAATAGYEEGTEYRCDGQDNDCDGQTDEALDTVALAELALVKGADPTHPVGTLPCLNEATLKGLCSTLQVATCKNAGTLTAAWDCPYERIWGHETFGTESLCDGQDNDCDGQTDVFSGPVDPVKAGCPTAQGVCTKATPVVACVNGEWLCSFNVGPTVPGYEPVETLCDNKDNDCDGQTDEGLALLNGDPALATACPTLKDTGVCQGAVTAVCGDAHTWECAVHVGSDYQPGGEILCDGKDNDCNGQTDEDFGAGATAAAKAANCPAYGQCAGHAVTSLTCSGGKPTCAYQGVVAYEAGKETLCDGKDNDCDGLVDSEDPDFLTIPASEVARFCPDKGLCQGKAVTFTCDHGKATCAYAGVTGYEAGAEVSCDGKDNDCDGLTDEEITRTDTTGACTGGGGVCAHGGRQACDGAGGWECDYGQVVGYEAVEQSCDNLDNDCDGQTDEDLGGALAPGAACLQVGACASPNVVVTCAGGAWTCDYSAADGWAAEEDGDDQLCDAVDNDCDGQTDEHACGGPGTRCAQQADCQDVASGGSPDAYCRVDIDGVARFCSANASMCVYSENDLWASQVLHGEKRCVDLRTTRTCQNGAWVSEAACPALTPYCTGTEGADPCRFCIPDALTCFDQATRGRCAVDGTKINADQPCLSGNFCAGDGLCISPAESVLNAYTSSLQDQPDVAWHPVTGFVVVWASKGQDNSDYGVFGRRVGHDGQRLGQELQVHRQTANVQADPAVDTRPDGGFTVAWRSTHAGPSAIYRRSFDAAGAPLEADDTLVSTLHPDKTKVRPDVAVNARGESIVAYQGTGVEGTDFGCTLATCKDGIVVRTYSAEGAADDEFVVNQVYRLNNQRNPSVAALSDHNFVVVWESEKQDSDSSYGVYGRIVKAGGVVSGSEFQVNQTIAGNQLTAIVEPRADGRFVVAWNTATVAGGAPSYTSWMRVFKNDGTPDGSEVKVSGDATDAVLTGVSVFGDAYMMVGWQQAGDAAGSAVYATYYTPELLTSGPLLVNQVTTGDQTALSIAATDIGTYLGAWVGPDASGTGTDIRMRLQLR